MICDLTLSGCIAPNVRVPPILLLFCSKLEWMSSILRRLFSLVLGNCELIVLIRQREDSVIEFILIKRRPLNRRDRMIEIISWIF